MSRPGLLYLLAGAFFFSLMSVCVKLAGERLPAEEIIVARAAISLVLSAAMARRAGQRFLGNARGLLVLRGLFGSCGLYCFFSAVTILPLAEVTTIHYLNPVLTALLAALWLREAMTPRLVVALVVSVCGVVLVTRPQFMGVTESLDPLGVGLALGGAVFSAVAYVIVRQLRTTDHPAVVVLYFPLVATPVFLPLALRVWVWPTSAEWLVLLGVGVTTQIAQICLTEGLSLVPAGRATAVGYVQIVFAMVWSALLFDVVPDLIAVGGAAVVFVGVAMVAIGGARRPGPPPVQPA